MIYYKLIKMKYLFEWSTHNYRKYKIYDLVILYKTYYLENNYLVYTFTVIQNGSRKGNKLNTNSFLTPLRNKQIVNYYWTLWFTFIIFTVNN